MTVHAAVAGLWKRTGRAWHPASMVAVLLLGPAMAQAQPVPEKDTLLLAQFDRSVGADFALGSPAADTRVEPSGSTAGRFGGGVDLDSGARIRLVGNDGNFHPPEGTIEFWIKPHWPGNDLARHSFFSCRLSERQYLNINTLGKGRLGIAIAAGEGSDWAWRRVDMDIAGWKPESWHHVAFAWGGGHLRVYVDGQEGPQTESDARMLSKVPEWLDIIGGDAVIDALRISRRMFTLDDARRSIQNALDPPYRYLAEMPWTPPEAATADRCKQPGKIRLPFVLGESRYLKAIGCRPATRISFALDGKYETLEADVGVDALGPEGAACGFEIWADGRKLLDSGPRTIRQGPLKVSVSVAGAKQLTLATRAEKAAGRAGYCVWGNALLSRKDAPRAMPATRKIKPEELDMYRRQWAADRYRFQPAADGAFFVAAKCWEDEIDPGQPPAAESLGRPLEAFATPGEYEPLNFVVYANQDIEKMSIEVSELRCGEAVLPASRIDARIVLRGLMRDLYVLPPERSTVVSRFLLPHEPVDIPAGTFREYHLIVHVGDDAAAGKYTGDVRLRRAGGPVVELPIVFEVLPFRLRPLTRKAYGVYYRFSDSLEDLPQTEVELADIRAHGATTLVSNLAVEYEIVKGQVKPSLATLRRRLALLKKHGFGGPLTVHTGCPRLARLLDYDPLNDYADRSARDRFLRIVKEAMEELADLSQKDQRFELLPTHMDEVLGRGRLEPYIRLTEAVRQVPRLRVYITLHNSPRPGVEEMLRRCDPYVDVRCYNGHAMDDWIRAGGTFEELEGQLKRAGDEAWVYYNIRGAFFKPEWTRLVGGLYMWVSPLRVHVPWMYYSYSGNPLDDTDGSRLHGHDFAYAVPDPSDPTRMISTRHWEAYREGIDDAGYLCTLEDLIAEQPGTPQASAARAWLAQLRSLVTPKPAELKSIEKESPILILLSEKFNAADYRRIRRQAAEHIVRLLALKH